MVRGAISSKGVVHLEILNGIQNAQKYMDFFDTGQTYNRKNHG
jgi:hypothetical protein